MFEICLVAYLFVGLIFAYACKDDSDRTLLVSNPLGGVTIVLIWPLVIWAMWPSIKSFKFAGKTRYERP